MNSIRNFIVLFYSLIFLFLSFFTVSAKIYEVGPEKEFSRIGQVPFDSLVPGDRVKIYYQEKAYKALFIIRTSGTQKDPIVIEGVPEKGKLPIIDGSSAVQFQTDNSKQFGRWLIKIGDKKPGNHIIIKNLHLRNANNTTQYLKQGKILNYEDNAGGIFLKYGHNITISKCIIQSCGNGIITGYMPYVNNLIIDNCIIFDNGNHKNPGSPYEHNVYLGSANTIIQFSRISNPHSGHCIKDRGQKTIIRYNWIEGGKNRQLDLVDYKLYKNANAYVYGNVIVQGKKQANRNIIHWGGDSGLSRSGTLYFFNNTVIGRSSRTDFLVTRYPDCSIYMVNNIFKGSGILWNATGQLRGSNNWFSNSINTPVTMIIGLKGASPGFVPSTRNPYLLGPNSVAINTGTDKIPAKVGYVPGANAGVHRRPKYGRIDLGAYEFSPKRMK